MKIGRNGKSKLITFTMNFDELVKLRRSLLIRWLDGATKCKWCDSDYHLVSPEHSDDCPVTVMEVIIANGK